MTDKLETYVRARDATQKYPVIADIKFGVMAKDLNAVYPIYLRAITMPKYASVDQVARARVLTEVYLELMTIPETKSATDNLSADGRAVLKDFAERYRAPVVGQDAILDEYGSAMRILDEMTALHKLGKNWYSTNTAGFQAVIHKVDSSVAPPVPIDYGLPADVDSEEEEEEEDDTPIEDRLTVFVEQFVDWAFHNENGGFIERMRVYYRKQLSSSTRKEIARIQPVVASILGAASERLATDSAARQKLSFNDLVSTLGAWQSPVRKDLYKTPITFIKKGMVHMLAWFGCLSKKTNSNLKSLSRLYALLSTPGPLSLFSAQIINDPALLDFYSVCHAFHQSLIEALRSTWSDAFVFWEGAEKHTWRELCLARGTSPKNHSIIQTAPICTPTSFGVFFDIKNPKNRQAIVMSLALGIVDGFDTSDAEINPVDPVVEFDSGYGTVLLQGIYALTSNDKLNVMRSKVKKFTLAELVKTIDACTDREAAKEWREVLNKAIVLSCYIRAWSVYVGVWNAGPPRATLEYVDYDQTKTRVVALPVGRYLVGATREERWGILSEDNIVDDHTFKLAVGLMMKYARAHYGVNPTEPGDSARTIYQEYNISTSLLVDTNKYKGNTPVPKADEINNAYNKGTVANKPPQTTPLATKPVIAQPQPKHAVHIEPEAAPESTGFKREISAAVEDDPEEVKKILEQYHAYLMDPAKNFSEIIDFVYSHAGTLRAEKQPISSPLNTAVSKLNSLGTMTEVQRRSYQSFRSQWNVYTSSKQ